MRQSGPETRTVEECFEALRPYGVSWGEAEVAFLLTRDHASDEEMAAYLGIGERAVQKRLQHLREKVSGENRRDVARRVRDIVRRYRDREPEPDEDGQGARPEASP